MRKLFCGMTESRRSSKDLLLSLTAAESTQAGSTCCESFDKKGVLGVSLRSPEIHTAFQTSSQSPCWCSTAAKSTTKRLGVIQDTMDEDNSGHHQLGFFCGLANPCHIYEVTLKRQWSSKDWNIPLWEQDQASSSVIWMISSDGKGHHLHTPFTCLHKIVSSAIGTVVKRPQGKIRVIWKEQWTHCDQRRQLV